VPLALRPFQVKVLVPAAIGLSATSTRTGRPAMLRTSAVTEASADSVKVTCAPARVALQLSALICADDVPFTIGPGIRCQLGSPTAL